MSATHASADAFEGIEDVYPLSPMQTGMLLHELASPGSDLLFLQWRITLEGPLDPFALARAFEDVAGRHPALRTSFAWEGLDEPLQIVQREVIVPWREVDLSGLTAEACAAAVDDLVAADRREGFCLEEAPLQRLVLARLAPDRHLLVWSHHHLVLDGWSELVILREVAARYEARLAGRAPPMPSGARFSDYIAWLRDRDDAAAERHWRGALADLTDALLPIPTRGAGDPVVELQVTLSPAEARQLKEAAGRRKITLNTLLQASWARVLAHHTGAGDVVFGAAVATRSPSLPGADGMVGVLLANLPVRVALRGEEHVVTWLTDIQEAQAAAAEHGHLPVERLQALSGRAPARPLFDTLVIFQNLAADAGALAKLGGATVRSLAHEVRVGFPLALIAEPGLDGSLTIRLRHEGGALDRALLQATLDAVVAVFRSLPGSFDAPVDRFTAPPAALTPLHSLVGRSADRSPAAPSRSPSTPSERRLAALFREALGVEHVGADDDFFDLGGSSLRALDLVRRIEAAFDVTFPLHAFLTAGRTVALGAAWLDRLEVENGATEEDFARLAALDDDEVLARLEAL